MRSGEPKRSRSKRCVVGAAAGISVEGASRGAHEVTYVIAMYTHCNAYKVMIDHVDRTDFDPYPVEA